MSIKDVEVVLKGGTNFIRAALAEQFETVLTGKRMENVTNNVQPEDETQGNDGTSLLDVALHRHGGALLSLPVYIEEVVEDTPDQEDPDSDDESENDE